MNEELNKELCGLLKICWHEWVTNYGHDSDELMCKHCWKYPREVACNPDFTSDSGKVQLLREMMKRKDSYGFFVDYLLGDTGKLAIAARDFLKGQKNEPTP